VNIAENKQLSIQKQGAVEPTSSFAINLFLHKSAQKRQNDLRNANLKFFNKSHLQLFC